MRPSARWCQAYTDVRTEARSASSNVTKTFELWWLVAAKSCFGMPEHLPEPGPRTHRRCETRSIVDHAVFGEEFDHFVVEPLIDAVRISVNEIDDLVLVEEPPKGGSGATIHQFSGIRALSNGSLAASC